MSTAVRFDPADPAFLAERYDTYRRLRDLSPVAPATINGQPSSVLTRYDDVAAAFKDARCRVQPTDADVPAHVGTGPAAEFYRLSLPCMDPPQHTRLRKLATPAFAPKAVAAMRGWIEECVRGGLIRLAEQGANDGAADFVADFAARVPAEIACRLVHAPVADAAMLLGRQPALNPVLSQGEITPQALAEADDAAQFYFDYLGDVVDTLAGKLPEDDPVGALMAAREAGDKLSRAELIATLIGFLIASHHTTMVSFTNAVHALLTHPDQLALLAADPDLAPSAWEEALRYQAPVHFVWRYATVPVEFSGQAVEAGSHILLGIASANRDERRFTDADRFDIRRLANRHLSFVAGGHFCLGAPLSRLEGDVFLRLLPAMLPFLALAQGEVAYFPDLSFRFIPQLAVTPGALAR
jgi:cytochrome P450